MAEQTEIDFTVARYADLAAASRDGESLLALAERAATAILDAQGTVTMFEVRLALAHVGQLANDGNERLDALGALARRMGLKAIGTCRPSKAQAKALAVSHSNRNTIWRRPESVSERAHAITEAGR